MSLVCALELTERHARDFPAGLFVQEREVVALEALLKLGRVRDANTRAAAFMRAYSDSAHARRVRALLERSHIVPPSPRSSE